MSGGTDTYEIAMIAREMVIDGDIEAALHQISLFPSSARRL